MKLADSGFTKNTTLIIFIILTLLILGLEFFLYQIEKNRLIEEEQRLLGIIAEKENTNLTDWYFSTKNSIELLSTSENFITKLNGIIRNPSDQKIISNLNDFFRKEVFEKSLLAILILDSDFKKVYSYQNFNYDISNITIENASTFDRENYFYVSRIIKKNHPMYDYPVPVSEVTIGLFTNQNDFKPSHFLTLVLDARKNIFPIINTFSNFRNTLETILLASEENELIYLNDLKFLFNSSIELKAKSDAGDIPGKKLNVSKKGVVEGFDYRGERVFAYITYVQPLNWFLVTKIDRKEVLIQTNKVLYTISGSIVLILFLFIIVLGVLWKREEVERIKKELEIQRMQTLMVQKYQIVSKYANDAFILISKDGTIVEANDKAVEMYGYSITELKGRPFVLLETPENRSEWNEILNRLRSDTGSLFESIHIDKNGNKFFVEISAKIISIDGELYLVAIIRNIEDRKKAELQLIESEKKFHTLFEKAYDAILILKDGIVIDCNSKATGLFNASKENIIQKQIKHFIAEENEFYLHDFVDAIKNLEKIEGKTFQLKLKKTTGEIFDGELNPSIVELKGEKVIQIFVRDITERNQFLSNLERFRRAIENLDEMMMITDRNGVIEYVNPAFEKITGYSLEEIKGKKPSVLKSGHHPQEFYQELWDTILSGSSWQGIIVNRKKDGTLYTEEMIISPIKDEKGEISAFVAIKKDVNERIKAEEELKRARLKAEESDRIKSNFLSMMSHEVRTPLNVILGFLDIIKASIRSEDFPEKDHIFSVIERNSKRLITLINDIIDISRIESNELKLDFHVYELQPLLMKSTAEFEMVARAKGLRIIDDYNVEGIYVNVDENRFHQIMANLLSNAIKFTSRGEITVSVHHSENKVYISVKDTGVGIPPEFFPYLFEFFRQAEEGYNRNFEGAGLGLAITKKLVNMMNGEIYVESQYGKGSTFTVVFPKVSIKEGEQPEIIEEKPVETEVAEIGEPTVLIVEDNKDNSFFVEVVLSKLGLKYYSVPNAREALDILANKKINLILMDISLADSMSGEDLLKVIKQNPQYQNIPIIAMTAHAMLGDRDHFISVGFAEYIAKPFTMDQLTKTIFNFLKKIND